MQYESDADHLEIEVKFLVENRSDMADRILRSGGVLVSDGFETNIRWDDASGSLAAKKCLLRLRTESGGKVILTFKSPPPADEIQFKVFIERELVVGDAEEMAAILEALGFYPVQIYEKERAVFRFDDVTLCLDRLPFGDFLEIEGGKEAIRHAAERLGLNWERRILDNYLSLFEKVRQSMGLPFSDVTFANFQGIRVESALLS